MLWHNPKGLNTKYSTSVLKMAQMHQKWDRVLELVFEYPNQKFTIREISKRTKIPSSSVQRYLEELRKEGVITKENRLIVTPYFKFKKAFFIIDRLFKIGLIDYLESNLTPSVIIVFGSARKGEYEKESDIDLFVESSVKKELNLKKFEKNLGHNIQLFIESDINKLHSNLRNNIINGIKLNGYLKVG